MQRTAVITGASAGIGFFTAVTLKGMGFRVFGVDMAPGPNYEGVEFIQADVSLEDDVKKAVKHLEAQTDWVDVLVNNAGVCPRCSLESTDAILWSRVLAVNLTGPFLMTRAALPLLKRSPSASIVNVASVHAIATTKNVVAYAASKGGLVSLTRALAVELAEYGIRVNCVLPGAVNTYMLIQGMGRGNYEGQTADERRQSIAARTPLKKVGTPEEIAMAIRFLGSAEEASFITGQTLVVDGGALVRLSTE